MSVPQGVPIPRPTNPNANQNIKGTAYAFDLLPLSNPGRAGPFELPNGTKPLQHAFDVWVEYYVNGIGAYIELFNAIQSKLSNDPGAAQELADRLADFAGFLDFGQSSSPRVLDWPFTRKFSSSPQAPLQSGGFAAFTVTFDCANGPTKYAVVNCVVQIHATWQIAPESNSSSYLATGSSSG